VEQENKRIRLIQMITCHPKRSSRRMQKDGEKKEERKKNKKKEKRKKKKEINKHVFLFFHDN